MSAEGDPNLTLLSQIAHEKGIRYFLVSFSDLRGVQRAKLVPAASIDRIASEGAGFAGFATWLDMTPADPDMLALADPRSLIQLPWKPEVACIAGDLVMPSGTDLYFTPEDCAADARAIPGARLLAIPSIWGHRAGNPYQNPADARFIRQAVEELLAA